MSFDVKSFLFLFHNSHSLNSSEIKLQLNVLPKTMKVCAKLKQLASAKQNKNYQKKSIQ